MGANRSDRHARGGHATGASRKSRRCKIETALQEADGNKGRAAELLQISYKMLLVEDHASTASSSGPRLLASDPIASRRAFSSSVVTSVTVAVVPIAVGSTKCSLPATPSCRGRRPRRLVGREVSDRWERSHARDQVAQRVATLIGEHAARRPRARPPPACRRRPPRHGGSACMRERLERVPDGVAEVERAARPDFAFVRGRRCRP